MEPQSSQRVWAWTGKGLTWGLTLVTFIGGVLFIYDRVNPRGPSLEAKCFSQDLGASHEVLARTVMRQILERVNPERLGKLLPAEAGNAARSPVALEKLAKALEEALTLSRLDLLSLRGQKDIVTCRVRNDGDEPAKEVAFNLPLPPWLVVANGKSLVERDPWATDSIREMLRPASVPLGTISTGPETIVEMWFLIPMYQEREISLNYAGGAGRVLTGTVRYGGSAAFPDFWERWSPLAINVATFIAGSALLVLGFLGGLAFAQRRLRGK